MTPSSGGKNLQSDVHVADSVRVERRVVRASGFVPAEAKMHPPPIRNGFVTRTELLARLAETSDTPVVLLTAPAGYGKTTASRQWGEVDARPFVWLTLDQGDNDPAVLLTYLMLLLQRLEPVDPGVLSALSGGDAALASVVLPRLGRMLRERLQPFVLVLDDADVLTEPDALRTIGVVIDNLAPGSQLVLNARAAPDLGWGRLRAQHRAAVLGVGDLRLTNEECRELVSAFGTDPDRPDIADLIVRTEGWATGLYLGLLSAGRQGATVGAVADLTGGDTLIAGYLRDELLAGLTTEEQTFLRRACVLDRLAGDVCDAVLERSGSALLLHRLAAASLFVVPIDDGGRWYRLHHLLAEMLDGELHRVEPDAVSGLHERASRWLERNGDIEGAIRHARLGGDVARAAGLVWAQVPAWLMSGRRTTLARRLAEFTSDELVSHPKLALSVAWCEMGTRASVRHWLSVAERCWDGAEGAAEGNSVRAGIALLRATLATDGVGRMAIDARSATPLLNPGDPWCALSHYLEGVALLVTGDHAGARRRLGRAERIAFATDVHSVRAISLGQLSLIALDGGDWAEAIRLTDTALALLEETGLAEVRASGFVFCLSALELAHRGLASEARLHARRAIGMVAATAQAAPWFAVQCRVILAQTQLLLGDVAAAHVLLNETRPYAAAVRDAGWLTARLDELRRQVDQAAGAPANTTSTVTSAELRVLQYLPSHLSLEQISQRLFVSRNTVKTQAISVYRKLGVSSRAQAVERAGSLGLLQD